MRNRILLLAVVTLLNVSCSKSNDLLSETFSENELKEVNEIISFYDEYVSQETASDIDISSAYQLFFKTRNHESIKNGDLGILIPEIDQDTSLVLSIKEVLHSEQYMSLLRSLSSRGDFFGDYYETTKNNGVMSPTNYAIVLKRYNEVDFTNKEERLVVILNLLHPLTNTPPNSR